MEVRETTGYLFWRSKVLKVFGVIVALAVAVGGGFAVFRLTENKEEGREEYIEENEDKSTSAEMACGKIKDEYTAKGLYYDEAVKMFEDEGENGDKLWQMFFAVCYANFVVDNGDDPYAAPLILKAVDISSLDTSAVRYYYLSMANIYRDINDEDNYLYYIDKTMALEGGEW